MNQSTKITIGLVLLVAAAGIGTMLFQQGGYLHTRALAPDVTFESVSTFYSQEEVDEYTQREALCISQQNEAIAACEFAQQEDPNTSATPDCTANALQQMLYDCVAVEE